VIGNLIQKVISQSQCSIYNNENTKMNCEQDKIFKLKILDYRLLRRLVKTNLFEALIYEKSNDIKLLATTLLELMMLSKLESIDKEAQQMTDITKKLIDSNGFVENDDMLNNLMDHIVVEFWNYGVLQYRLRDMERADQWLSRALKLISITRLNYRKSMMQNALEDMKIRCNTSCHVKM